MPVVGFEMYLIFSIRLVVFFTGHDSTREMGHEDFEVSRVGPGRVRRFSKLLRIR